MNEPKPEHDPRSGDLQSQLVTEPPGEADSLRDADMGRRSLGAKYLSARVLGDVGALTMLHERHEPSTLLAGLATTCRLLVSHIAALEGTSPKVVVDAYRDVWQQTP